MHSPKIQSEYDPFAKLLHWAVASLWIAVWVIGILAVYWRDALNPDHGLSIAHKAMASAMLALIAIRVVWRMTHPAPPAITQSRFMQRAAHAGHLAIYALALIALPLSGWVWSSVADKPIMVVWLVKLPPIVAPAPAYYDLAKLVHVSIAWTAGILIAGHVLMALKHHVIDRDDTLRGMLPRRFRCGPIAGKIC